MSREIENLVRSAYEFFNREKRAFPHLWHPDGEYVNSADPDGGVHRGRDAIEGLASRWIEVYPDLRIEPVEVQINGSQAFVWTRFSGHGAVSGVPIDMQLAHCYALEDGKIRRIEEYFDRAEALAAVGLHESDLPLPPQRLALPSDAPRIAELMRASVLELFPRFYDERQTASAAVHIAHLDMQLIEDGTYFVHQAGVEIVACGGWSRRNKLYSGSGDSEDDDRLLDPRTEPARVRAMFVRSDWTRRGLGRAILDSCEHAARTEGFTRLVLGATLPGEPLYRAFGFREVERFMVKMPDGVEVECVGMERPVERIPV